MMESTLKVSVMAISTARASIQMDLRRSDGLNIAQIFFKSAII
jgi:hypothetical protein